MANFRTPFLTVDLIIEMNGGVVLIERKNPPPGWALPGGFVDHGESLETAAVREAKEETSLDVELVRQFHAYSDPARDARQHNATVVFIARARGGASFGGGTTPGGRGFSSGKRFPPPWLSITGKSWEIISRAGIDPPRRARPSRWLSIFDGAIMIGLWGGGCAAFYFR